jgi:glycolate oxidase
MGPHQELLGALPNAVTIDPDIIEGFRRDRAAWAAAGTPLALVRPSSTSEVQVLARWANRHRIALVPRGAGTGVAGAANASDGCVMVSFERMNRILEVDSGAMLAVVQPGVLTGAAKKAAREVGLWYPPDPSSFEISTIGGNVATNAGGLCCARYGVTGNYVLGLEMVLADGTVVRVGGRTRKDVAGYGLTQLIVGSEGTLGLITEITLRLRRLPPPTTTVVATFASLEAAGMASAAIVRATDPQLLELMDGTALRAVEAYRSQGLDSEAAAMLIAQTDARATEEGILVQEACHTAGAILVAASDDEAEGRAMMTARRLAYDAVEQMGQVLVDDLSVPLSLLPRMLRRVQDIAAAHSTLVATVAHAGDGNLHPMVVFDPAEPGAEERATATFEALMMEAIAMGGTISGEHGIGLLKRPFLSRQLGPASMALHARIKRAFDPDGILNPGKLLP